LRQGEKSRSPEPRNSERSLVGAMSGDKEARSEIDRSMSKISKNDHVDESDE